MYAFTRKEIMNIINYFNIDAVFKPWGIDVIIKDYSKNLITLNHVLKEICPKRVDKAPDDTSIIDNYFWFHGDKDHPNADDFEVWFDEINIIGKNT